TSVSAPVVPLFLSAFALMGRSAVGGEPDEQPCTADPSPTLMPHTRRHDGRLCRGLMQGLEFTHVRCLAQQPKPESHQCLLWTPPSHFSSQSCLVVDALAVSLYPHAHF
ncbi:hypothetical protein B0H14DRAFT_2925898, partial [Mycena olivaceomarginata]